MVAANDRAPVTATAALWFAACCERVSPAQASAADLWVSYSAWCAAHGFAPLTIVELGRWLAGEGLERAALPDDALEDDVFVRTRRDLRTALDDVLPAACAEQRLAEAVAKVAALEGEIKRLKTKLEQDTAERKRMWADIRAVQPDPTMRRLSEAAIDRLDSEAEAAFALADEDDDGDRQGAIALGMLVEWQRNPGPKVQAAEARLASVSKDAVARIVKTHTRCGQGYEWDAADAILALLNPDEAR
jgi:phage host-nuclease inhibitor protein Gam